MVHVLASVCILFAWAAFAAFFIHVLSWNAFKLIRRPEIGPWFGILVLVCLLIVGIRIDRGIAVTIFLLLFVAFASWPAGADWRDRHPRR